ncbi:MAG TPA: hypothetical protein VGP80_03035 [Gemmatimonadales bacterium]|jgi:hypothetical protein|nr:hypothetical protein [Gemmatimonadales bacterium]
MLTVLLLAATLGSPVRQDTASLFRWTGTLPAGATLEVRGVIGSIRADAASGREVSVEATRTRGHRGLPEDVAIRVFEDSGRVLICAIYPRSRWQNDEEDRPARDACEVAGRHRTDRGENDTRVDYIVKVPAGVHFVGETVTEDVTVTGLHGSAEGYSVAGNVTMRDIRGSVVDAASISGDISFLRVDAPRVYAGTLSGDVSFDGVIRQSGDYELLSWNGAIAVALPKGAGIEFEVHASSRDDLHSSVPLVRSLESRRRYGGKQGDGSAKMNLTSFGGDIRISSPEH